MGLAKLIQDATGTPCTLKNVAIFGLFVWGVGLSSVTRSGEQRHILWFEAKKHLPTLLPSTDSASAGNVTLFSQKPSSIKELL